MDRKKMTNKEWILILMFYLILLQNPLEMAMPVFKYTDEILPMIGLLFASSQMIRRRKLRFQKNDGIMVLAFLLFLMSGILGNVIYRYQPLNVVLIDLYTNMKFFLSVISGYVFFRSCDLPRVRGSLVRHARFAAAVLFALLLMDQFFHIFPYAGMRYGLRVAQLFYYHPTYLAGAMVFLLTVLTAFYQKQNNRYIAMSLVVLFFTLRGKAVAGAAVYCLIFYFVLAYRKKLKVWHIAVIFLAVFFIAHDQFSYYYIELEGRSARSVLTQTAVQIAKDYFPIGTGFGTYASSSAGANYSPVYVMYGFLDIYELGGGGTSFFNDTFWPIIIGQTGVIGTICYLFVLLTLFHRVMKIHKINIFAYATGVFIFAYMLISSTSEPTFNNSIAVPLALVLGYVCSLGNRPHEGAQPRETHIQDRME